MASRGGRPEGRPGLRRLRRLPQLDYGPQRLARVGHLLSFTIPYSWSFRIRFAAAPLGGRRFRAPEVPPTNRRPQNATAAAPICPQSAPALSSPEIQQLFTLNDPQSEDCLFLNVYAPENAENLPVFVWVHGGGYELGAMTPYDPSSLINTNKQDFVAVVIQYRLGAFGFLSSEEVRHKGALNAGLLDQQMTLQWVQKYIGLFGGDASRVTLAGESAGAGSVMNHIIAYGGAQGDQLFSNVSFQPTENCGNVSSQMI